MLGFGPLVNWQFFICSLFFKHCVTLCHVSLFAERVASPPVSTNSESNDATIPSNVTVALPSIVPSNQPVAATTTTAAATTTTAAAMTTTTTNISSNKVKIPPVNKKINLDCDNSSVTEPISAETVSTFYKTLRTQLF